MGGVQYVASPINPGRFTLARSEITELLAEGKPVETSCDACGARYEITSRELTEVLRSSDASIDSETSD